MTQEITDKIEAIVSGLGFIPTKIKGMYKKDNVYLHIYVEQTIVIFPNPEPDQFHFEFSVEDKSIKVGYYMDVEKIIKKFKKNC